ncbi:tryptophan dimethylallyltransferase domain-containing protein [Hirsutella rhossiliensis]
MAENALTGGRGTPKAWAALQPLMPPLHTDSDYWWKLSGPCLATLMEAAGYSAEKQFEALVFHYHWIIPYMGPAPSVDGKLKWPSMFSKLNGMPMTYSWKWNTPTAKPEVRYTLEATNLLSGSEMDPLNQDPTNELLRRLRSVLPSLDLTWMDHFLSTLYDDDRQKYTLEAVSGAKLASTTLVSAEFAHKGLTMKTWFIPRKLGYDHGKIPMELWEQSLAQLDPANAARAAVYDFIKTSSEGKMLSPFMLGVDNVTPSKSRIKMYFRTPHTSFASVREVMTLGGRIAFPETKMQELKSLVAAVACLNPDFDDNSEVRPTPGQGSGSKGISSDLPAILSGFIYYFDIAPGGTLPDIKLYIQQRYLGQDDASMANGVMSWMENHGRGQFCQSWNELGSLI